VKQQQQGKAPAINPKHWLWWQNRNVLPPPPRLPGVVPFDPASKASLVLSRLLFVIACCLCCAVVYDDVPAVAHASQQKFLKSEVREGRPCVGGCGKGRRGGGGDVPPVAGIQ
jgi:hypothetical protein